MNTTLIATLMGVVGTLLGALGGSAVSQLLSGRTIREAAALRGEQDVRLAALKQRLEFRRDRVQALQQGLDGRWLVLDQLTKALASEPESRPRYCERALRAYEAADHLEGLPAPTREIWETIGELWAAEQDILLAARLVLNQPLNSSETHTAQQTLNAPYEHLETAFDALQQVQTAIEKYVHETS